MSLQLKVGTIERKITAANLHAFTRAASDFLLPSSTLWKPGMTASFALPITDFHVCRFALATGDINPIHLDDQIAARSMFKNRVAHGMLTMARIGALIRSKFCGRVAEFEVRFTKPVFIRDDVSVVLNVIEPPVPGSLRLEITATVGSDSVLKAFATVEPGVADIGNPFFIGGLFSAVLGTKCPGPGTIYVAQKLRYVQPVMPGDLVQTTAIICDEQPSPKLIALNMSSQSQSRGLYAEGRALVLYDQKLADLLSEKGTVCA